MTSQMRGRTPNSDANQNMLNTLALQIYQEMGILSKDTQPSTPRELSEIISQVPTLDTEQQKTFAAKLVSKIVDTPTEDDKTLLECVPPTTLAYAYDWTKTRLEEDANDADAQRYKNALTNKIDDLITQFDTKSGYYFADITNIADVYDGYNKMFDARKKDLTPDSDLFLAITRNQELLNEFMNQYDDAYKLSELTPDNAEEFAQSYDKLADRMNGIRNSDDNISDAAQYKFLDKDGNTLPQFLDKNGKLTQDFGEDVTIDPNGRLQQIIDIARQNVAMKHAGDDTELTDKELEQLLDDELLQKLFELDTVGKVADVDATVNKALLNEDEECVKLVDEICTANNIENWQTQPHHVLVDVVKKSTEQADRFSNPEYLQKFKDDLKYGTGGTISETGYQAALDYQVNSIAGWAGRVKQKVKGKVNKVRGLFTKVFQPIEKIDKLAPQREGTQPSRAELRKQRIQFLKRALKGFGNGFLISATLTTIATAAAATTGASVAAVLAGLGLATTAITTTIQIKKWRKQQTEMGKPTSFKEFIKDKRMLATIGASALAGVAMGCGAAGLASVARNLGIGAMVLSGGNNALATYRDARNSGMGTTESVAWALGNAGAVIGGGFAGRAVANAGIAAYNQHHPENTIFQEKTTESVTRTETHTETHEEYAPGVRENAQKIAEMWYKDNPGELQNRVDLINQYNAEHGTTIDPYRAIVMNADAGGHTFDNMGLHVDGGGTVHSGGQHTVMTRAWGAEHGFSNEDLSALRHMFNADNTINPDAMNAAIRADHIVSANNEIGNIAMRPAHYDGVLPQNAVDANGQPIYTTYTEGQAPINTVTTTTTTTVTTDVDSFNPLNIGIMGAIGQFLKRINPRKAHDRPGSVLDTTSEHTPKPELIPIPEPKPEPIPLPEPKPIPYTTTEGNWLAEEYDTFHGKGSWAYLTDEEKNRYENMVRRDLENEPDKDKYKNLNEYILQRLDDFDMLVRTKIDPLNKKANPKEQQKAIAETRQKIWKSNANMNDMTLQDFMEAVERKFENDGSGDVWKSSKDSKKGPLIDYTDGTNKERKSNFHRKDKRFKDATQRVQISLQEVLAKDKENRKKKKALTMLSPTQKSND